MSPIFTPNWFSGAPFLMFLSRTFASPQRSRALRASSSVLGGSEPLIPKLLARRTRRDVATRYTVASSATPRVNPPSPCLLRRVHRASSFVRLVCCILSRDDGQNDLRRRPAAPEHRLDRADGHRFRGCG